MRVWVTRLRGIGLFYRGVAPVLLSSNAGLLLLLRLPVLVPLLGLREARVSGVPPGLVLAKLLSGLAVWYLVNELRPQQYWFYYNLGLSKAWLWGGVAVLDGALFLGAAEVLAGLGA